MIALTEDTALPARFAALTDTLRRHRGVWGPRPFAGLPVAWEPEHPEVTAWLDAQPIDVFDDFEGGWVDARAPTVLRAWAAAGRASAAHGPLAVGDMALSTAARRRIPGRKAAQIERFVDAAFAAGLGAHETVVDWCAGKGHLGRAVCARSGARLVAVEWDPALCEEGRARSAHEGIDAEFVCLDARGAAAAARLEPWQAAVALHACGDLHAALLRAAVARPLAFVAVAPCCYNRAGAERGHALSDAGAAADLGLSTSDLDLIHREQVVARGRDRRRAWQSMAWRLGFDCLQREALGGQGYRTMPPFPNAWLKLPFAEFCARFAASDDLRLPAGLDPSPYEARGWVQVDRVRRRDAVRGLFRPALEAWLVLDRALFLAERGFTVQVGTFCERAVSPRNALVLARWPGS